MRKSLKLILPSRMPHSVIARCHEYCEKVRDYVSRDLFASILSNEEEHVDFLETQFDMISSMGLQNYVQLQSSPAED